MNTIQNSHVGAGNAEVANDNALGEASALPAGELTTRPDAWRTAFQTAISYHQTPAQLADELQAGISDRLWTKLTKADGKLFDSFEDFCQTSRPDGLGTSQSEVMGLLATMMSAREVQLATARPARQGKRTDRDGTSTSRHCDGKSATRSQERERAIADRCPEPVKKLYVAELIGKLDAERFSREEYDTDTKMRVERFVTETAAPLLAKLAAGWKPAPTELKNSRADLKKGILEVFGQTAGKTEAGREALNVAHSAAKPLLDVLLDIGRAVQHLRQAVDCGTLTVDVLRLGDLLGGDTNDVAAWAREAADRLRPAGHNAPTLRGFIDNFTAPSKHGCLEPSSDVAPGAALDEVRDATGPESWDPLESIPTEVVIVADDSPVLADPEEVASTQTLSAESEAGAPTARAKQPIKDCMAQFMGDRAMTGRELYEVLKAHGIKVRSNDPGAYVGWMLHSFKETFEPVPNKKRGFYRVKKSTPPAE
jgi:hypothetical protein